MTNKYDEKARDLYEDIKYEVDNEYDTYFLSEDVIKTITTTLQQVEDETIEKAIKAVEGCYNLRISDGDDALAQAKEALSALKTKGGE